MVIYVDDFKLAGPAHLLSGIWAKLRTRIKMDDPGQPGRFLGCYTRPFQAPIEAVSFLMAQDPRLLRRPDEGVARPYLPSDPSRIVRGYVYDMQPNFEDNVEHVCARHWV